MRHLRSIFTRFSRNTDGGITVEAALWLPFWILFMFSIGEVAMVPVAAAIANAIYHATGFRPNELPIRPQQIMEAIG